MPAIEVVFYKEPNDTVPVQGWLSELSRRQPRVFAKCLTRIERLAEIGHEIRRPESDFLRDGIHELRIRFGSVNYRILYFFHEREAAVLTHALTKEAAVPDKEIERAVERMQRYLANPEAHTYRTAVKGKDNEDDE